MEKMKICDLHTHSNCSDGSYSPEKLIGIAEKAGISAIALCDHNTVSGLSRFEGAAKGSGVIAVPGVEVTAGYDGKEVHIVGLFVRETVRNTLCEYLDTVNVRKKKANRDLIGRLAKAGYEIDYEAVDAIAGEAIPNRVHVARALMAKGYIASVEEGFFGILSEKAGFYKSAERLDAFEVIAFLRSLGIVPILAHPLLNLSEEALRGFLPSAKEAGLLAMEVYYGGYTDEQVALAKSIAEEFDILPSGGSDFHGDNKPENRMGKGKVPFEVFEALRRKIHTMNLKPAPFAMIKSGLKTIELRLCDEKRRQIEVGDSIVFTNTETGEELTACVAALHRFADFAELYRSLPLLKCGYTEKDIAFADPADMNVYYSPEKQEKYGVLGIEIKRSKL